MKFASFPKFALLSLLAGVFALVLTGCGASNNLALPAGNWSMTATPSGAATFSIGGNLTQSGTNLVGTMYVINSLCYSPSQTVAFTGTVKGSKVTLTSASVGGEVLSITASGTAGSLTGTYSIAGGTSCNGQTGTLVANPVPSVSGTWTGPIVDGNGDLNAKLTIALTQAATASADGTFAVTGKLTYSGSTCSVSGTLQTSSFMAGTYIVVQGDTIEFDGSAGTFTYYPTFLNNPTSPTNMQGPYQQTFGPGFCTDSNPNATTFTKQ
jgi:hypothetical protein